MTRPVRVVLIDDTPDLRDLLRFSLEVDGRFEVVGEAGDGREGVEVVGETQPDAVLLDLSMPVLDGARALPLIREVSPDTAVVIYTAFFTAEVAENLLHSGAVGVITKTMRPTEIAAYLVEITTRIPQGAGALISEDEADPDPTVS